MHRQLMVLYCEGLIRITVTTGQVVNGVGNKWHERSTVNNLAPHWHHANFDVSSILCTTILHI